ncbi:MAG TPA: hypothetical protein VF062_28670 [Candidatus Limnocylindrales bacterium]
MRPEEEGVRRHPGLDFMTSDSPSGYLVESEIAMLGRLGGGGSRRRRVLGRVLAVALLVAFVVPMLVGFWRIFLT